MLKSLLKKAGLTALIASLSINGYSEDIDIFNGNPAIAATRPNVLIIMDNTANWNAPFTYEKAALVSTFGGLTSEFNVGLMMFTETGGGNGTPDGAYVRAGIRNMTSTNRSALSSVVNNVHILDDKSNGGKLGLTMNEAYLYFKGGTAYAGHNKVKRDYTGNVISTGNALSDAASNSIYALPGNALASSGATAYNSPINSTNNCAKNFIIYISNGPAQDNASDTNTATTRLSSEGGNTATISLNPAGSQDNAADEWARFMFGTDIRSDLAAKQNIITYTIDVEPGTTGQGPGHTALLKSMANVGGGKYFSAADVSSLTTALTKIFDEIQAVDSVFASVALPVTVNVRGSFLNQVYMGVFRPDQYSGPRWPGNLKQYKVDYDPATFAVFLSDKNDLKIEDSATGFVVPGAVSYWTTKNLGITPDSTGGFWEADPQGLAGAFDSPDGNRVEKGGAAQRLRKTVLTADYTTTAGATTNPRKLYTYCPSGSGCIADLTATSNVFASSNSDITSALLGAIPNVGVTLSRAGTTVTATSASAHGFVTGDSITITGASPADYNGTYAVTVTGANSFTFPIVENPPTPAMGSYIASLSGVTKTVSLLTRSGSTATANVTAHGYASGTQITISGANQPEYNGTFAISSVTANSFTYPITPGPATPATGGTATVGSKSISISTVVRSGTTVTVTTAGVHEFKNNNIATIAGVSVAGYNGSFKISGISGANPTTFSFDVVETPSSPATTATTITVSEPSVVRSPVLLSRTGNTVTASFSSTDYLLNGFSNGQTLSIGGTPGTNEAAYLGSYVISNVTTGLLGAPHTFDYSISTTPGAAGGTIIASKAGTTDRTTLINWVRGQDNFGDESSPGSPYTVRPSIHGDVLHSNPAVINYGRTSDQRDIVIFYGANDGALHAAKGGRDDADGYEMWGLVFPEHYNKLNRLRANTPIISPSTPKPYFVDGALTTYFKDANADGQLTSGVSGDVAYLYATMRRGGRFMYALDVTNPDVPSILWRKRSTDTGFSELGQTWSDVKTGKVNIRTISGGALTEKAIAIFGGGYDPAAEDALPATTNTMGRAIYIVDAVTGDIIKSFGPADGLTHAIPSAVTAMDRDGDGYTDRFYVGDTGGNLWRVDMYSGSASDGASGLTSSWTLSKIASIAGSGANARKFMGAPSVVYGTAYDAILLGSGDREHPFDTTITNRFYMFKDTNPFTPGAALNLTESDLYDATDNLVQQGTATEVETAKAALDSASGWYFTLDTGEKVVGSAVTVLGTTFFGTNKPTPPDPATCSSNLGEARIYSINFENGAAVSENDNVAGLTKTDRFVKLAGGGLPPSPVSVQVKTDDGVTVTGVITGPKFFKPADAGRRSRVYWYLNTD